MTGSYCKCIFSFTWNCQAVFQSDRTTLYPSLQYLQVPVHILFWHMVLSILFCLFSSFSNRCVSSQHGFTLYVKKIWCSTSYLLWWMGVQMFCPLLFLSLPFFLFFEELYIYSRYTFLTDMWFAKIFPHSSEQKKVIISNIPYSITDRTDSLKISKIKILANNTISKLDWLM